MIDPTEQVDRDLKLIHELGPICYVLDTHVHADHDGGGQLRRLTGALSGVAGVADVVCADRSLVHGDMVRFGQYGLEVRSTPGHTNGCLTYVVQADGRRTPSQDALFIEAAGEQIFNKVMPPHSIALYTSRSILCRMTPSSIQAMTIEAIVSTVAEELAHNPRLNQGVVRQNLCTRWTI